MFKYVLVAFLALLVPSYAQDVCITKDMAKELVLTIAADAVVAFEDDYTIRFSSDTQPTDLVVQFDHTTGCAVEQHEEPKAITS